MYLPKFVREKAYGTYKDIYTGISGANISRKFFEKEISNKYKKELYEATREEELACIGFTIKYI